MKKPSPQLRYQKNHPEIIRGRITLWLGKELKADVVKIAKERGHSVSGIVRVLLGQWVQNRK